MPWDTAGGRASGHLERRGPTTIRDGFTRDMKRARPPAVSHGKTTKTHRCPRPARTLGETHSLQQFLEARVGTQGVDEGVDFEVEDPWRVLVDRPVQPLERLVTIP